MKQIDWYFDFISPFAYLASARLDRLTDRALLRPKPILFAGLLQHWHTLGPAEIPPMRRFTFRQVCWLAERDGIELNFPPMHPFNPLKLLRLCVLLDADTALVQRLFRFVWAEGRSADDPRDWQRLVDELGVADAETAVAADGVKQDLRRNTEQALTLELFGVPAFVVDGEVFWGYDSIDFLLDYLHDPAILQTAGMRAADTLPEGPGRPR